MLPEDLPKVLPTFIARLGTDERCHAYPTALNCKDPVHLIAKTDCT
jgi:hypothetical protein